MEGHRFVLTDNPENGTAPTSGAVPFVVSLKGLGRAFRSSVETVWAVRDVDLEVPAGQFVCLLGASGSGKSTLLHLIAGLDSPTTGSAVVAGTELALADENVRARLRLTKVGMVFQDHNLIEEFTAGENVLLPLEAAGVAPKRAWQEVDAAMESVGLAGLKDRYPRQLSGGQRQRVGIARALVGSRALVLADEPTGALDSSTSADLFALLRKLCDAGSTVIMATHDHAAIEYADVVHRIVDGRLSRDVHPAAAR